LKNFFNLLLFLRPICILREFLSKDYELAEIRRYLRCVSVISLYNPVLSDKRISSRRISSRFVERKKHGRNHKSRRPVSHFNGPLNKILRAADLKVDWWEKSANTWNHTWTLFFLLH